MVANGDERKQIDYAMTKLRSFVQQMNVGMMLVSHLSRPSGDKGYEDGIEPTLAKLRGSQSIAQLSDVVLAVSRNASDGENRLKVRCLKERHVGNTGELCELIYNPDSGLLEEAVEFEAEVIKL